MAWAAPDQPLPMQINPRIVFERMFGDGGTAEERAHRMRMDKSLLDAVMSSASELQQGLGVHDRARIDDYLDNLREVERRIGNLEARSQNMRLDIPDAPVDIPELYDDHVSLMFDLQALAFQSDTTRVTTFMLSRELNNRTYPQIGVPGQHHAIHLIGFRRELDDHDEGRVGTLLAGTKGCQRQQG